MRRLPLLLLTLAITAAFALQGEPSAVANTPAASPLRINLLDTRNEGLPTLTSDPFHGDIPAPAVSEPLSTPSVRSAAPSLPTFKILGKQEDESGWSVFLTLPERGALVWVVREGETFNEQYRVTRLAPPELLIQRLGSKTTRRYDIGKPDHGNDEE